MWRLLMKAVSTVGVLQALARAQESTAVHPNPNADPVEIWGTRFLFAAIGIGITLLLFTLFKYRGRPAGALSWALLVAGICIVPIVCTGFGTLLVFDRAERVEFCASCHLTMKGFVQDMTDPKSESLAAVHFKNKYIPDNQCYVCHTSYGMFGTVEAKLSGMIDVYKYYTRTFHPVIKMREPYPNHDCLKCHRDSAKWRANQLHIENEADLVADRKKCKECHETVMGHPAHPEGANKVAMR